MRKSRGRRHDGEPDGRLCRMCGTVVAIAADGRCPLGHRVESPAPPQASPQPAQTAPVAQSPEPGTDAATLPPVAALPAPPPRLLVPSGNASGAAPSPAAGASHWDPDDALAWMGDHKTPTAFPADAPADAPADDPADASGEASADALAWLAELDASADTPAERPTPSPAYAPSDGGLASALDDLLAWDEPASSASDVSTEEVATPEPPATPGPGAAGRKLAHDEDQLGHTAHAPTEHDEHAPTDHDEHTPTDHDEHTPTDHTVHAPTDHTVHAPTVQDEHTPTDRDEHTPTEQDGTEQDGTARRRLATLLAAACLGVMTGLAAAALAI